MKLNEAEAKAKAEAAAKAAMEAKAASSSDPAKAKAASPDPAMANLQDFVDQMVKGQYAAGPVATATRVPPPMAKSCDPAGPPLPPPKSGDPAGPPLPPPKSVIQLVRLCRRQIHVIQLDHQVQRIT